MRRITHDGEDGVELMWFSIHKTGIWITNFSASGKSHGGRLIGDLCNGPQVSHISMPASVLSQAQMTIIVDRRRRFGG